MLDLLYIIGLALWIALSSCPLALTHCCCCKAGMITEPFTHAGISSDWEVRSGTWTNPSGTYYQTSSTDAVILRIEPLDTQESNGINITMHARGEPRDTKTRIIFGWQDDSNFYAVEVRTEQRTSYQGCNDTPSFGYYIFGKIIKRVGGVESDIAGESHSFIEGGGYPVNDWFIMACYDESSDSTVYNTHLLFNVAAGPGVQPFPPTLKCYLPPLGRRVGLGTGSLVTNPAQFDNFIVNCPVTCTTWLPCNVSGGALTSGGCLPATQPTQIEASFGGLVPQIASGPCGTVASPCDAVTCTALDGPFLMSKSDPCTWSYATPIAHCGTLYQPDGQDFFYTIHVQIKPGTGAHVGKMVAEVTVTEVLDDPSVCKVFTGTFVIVASLPGDCRATASGFLTPSLWCAQLLQDREHSVYFGVVGMNYCQWSSLQKGGSCVRCGYVLRRDYDRKPGRMCDRQDDPPRKGLGDYVAAGLEFVGITKPVVTAVIGPCGCEERQEALNELGKKIGF